MLQNIKRSKSMSPTGSVLLEFAVIVPLMFMVLAGIWELTKTIKTEQTLSTISWLAADAATRECIFLADRQECFNNVLDRVQGFADPMVPGVGIVLGVYEYTPPGSLTSPDTVTASTQIGTPGFKSRLPSGTVNYDSRYPLQHLSSSKLLSVGAEVFLAQPQSTFLSKVYGVFFPVEHYVPTFF